MQCRDEDVIQYLREHPAFFEQHASDLMEFRLRSGYGGRVISLQERQAELLRSKIKHLELNMLEMIRHGNENAMTAEKLHRWTLDMLAVLQSENLPKRLLESLNQYFSVPQVALRLWDLPECDAYAAYTHGVRIEDRSLVQSLGACLCGSSAELSVVDWLPEPALAMSVALLPLRLDVSAEPFGLLLLASPDPERFHAGIGTDFLERISEIAAAALSRLY